MSDALSLILIVWWTVLVIIYLGFFIVWCAEVYCFGYKEGLHAWLKKFFFL